MKDTLGIFLVTYNRKEYLKRTFNQIFGEFSPIKDLDITILDNASTDGSSELIEEYCKCFPNIKHIRHNVNIGGNANICRAFELAASSAKEYVWVLCDDDKYNFSNWNEVKTSIDNKDDIICIADYVFHNEGSKNDFAHQLLQLTFVPAGIYKIANISDTVLTNMYDSIYTMFQQACLTISVYNHHKKITVLSQPIVCSGLCFEDRCEDVSYTRGSIITDTLKRRQDTSWILGYSNVLSLLKDKHVITKCMEVAINSPYIYGNWSLFYKFLLKKYMNMHNFNYICEICNCLPRKSLIYFFKIFLRQIFSVHNSDLRHKRLTICFLKFSFKRPLKKICKKTVSEELFN